MPWPVAVFAGGLVLRQDGYVAGGIGVGGSVDPADDAAVAHAAHRQLTAR